MASVIEPNTSRNVQYNNGSPVATRTFIILDAQTEADVYALFKLDGEPPTNIPNKFSAYPNLSQLQPPVSIVAMDFTLTRDAGVVGKWDLSITYRETSSGGPITQLSPNDTGYVTLRGSTESAMTDMWRTYSSDSEFESYLAAKAPLGNPLFSATDPQGDIGGLRIDVMGRASRSMTMFENIVADVTMDQVPNVRAIRDTIGSRNMTSFLGLPVGAVLFRGARWTNIAPGKWQVSYDFVADYFYHLIQQPITDTRGDVIRDSSGNARYVNWVQPYPRIADHRLLSPYLLALP